MPALTELRSLLTRKPLVAAVSLFFLTALTPATSAAQNGDPNGAERYVSIDFNDVDINVFIKFISELTQRNFIVDRRVQGKVTIISPSKISVDEAYRVFESVLEVHGFTTVRSGEVTKVVPAPDARTKSIETLLQEEALSPSDKIVTQLMPLRYADPDELKRLFAPLVSKSSVVLAYPPTNMLIITDVYSNIKRLMGILKVIDVPGIGREITVVPLENGNAAEMVRLLDSVFQQTRQAKGAQGQTAAPTVESPAKFVADERTNSLIIVASEDDTGKIRKLVNRLDDEIPRGKEKIHVYYLEHATAEELAETLQSLSGRQAAAQEGGKKTDPIVSESVKITADKPTNSLIIMAERDEYVVIEEIIQKLDVPRAMVYIESLLMEVDVNNGFGLGTEWIAGGKVEYGSDRDAWLGGGFSGGGDNAFSNLSGIGAAAAAGGTALLPQGFSMGIFGESIEIGGVTFQNLGALAQAFRRDTSTHILSTPQLLTTDNEEAFINVGKNVPFQTRTGTTSTSEVYNTFEYRDVGITLKVTPQVSKDRLIRLTLEQTLTALDSASNTGSAERPTTFKREVNTTVIVRNGHTVVLGGLIDDSFSESENRIPCLGDIPGLGWAFRSLNRGRQKTNLYIFLTPHVVRNEAEAAAIYQEKREEIDRHETDDSIKLYRDRKPSAFEDIPTLPELMEQ
ncbi:MAG: type II secretion system secretin GspD [Desulfococcaceae bacterium]